ncbi:MAG: DNA/RNA non-specific endonuclease [Sphingomonas phyllosphaerae]|uniref:DNA/RNA non-specific endonuclease n=1 Tax=Sphingomonas phyllosphaerae TaxID=257003 RepID=UPI002FFADCD1
MTSFAPDYRPRLADMVSLGDEPPVALGAQLLEARRRGPRVTDAATLKDRTGYAADFLGDFYVSWPSLIGSAVDDLLAVPSSRQNRLDYTHFSVAMSRARRMAVFVGVNIDGNNSISIPRSDDRWSLDGRIALDAQLGEELYTDNALDRGHLVRREDPNWGEDASTANEDTFHFTNCAPQMAGFNQKTWLSLETYILANTRRWQERATVFSGPIFKDDDRVYRGARIPTAFWKVVAFLSDEHLPSATAYMIDQRAELGGLEAAFGAFKTYQRSVQSIAQATSIDFSPLARFDGFSNEENATGTRIEAELRSPADVRV